jgi:lipoyl(octanoyl) transferase
LIGLGTSPFKIWRSVLLSRSGTGISGRVGVWVVRPDRPPQADGSPAEDKIAAIGVRIRRWVSFHGIAINVEPDLEHFAGIVPCGIRGHGVTSLVDLGLPVSMADLDVALREAFGEVFGPV